jgi:hypothetical protein
MSIQKNMPIPRFELAYLPFAPTLVSCATYPLVCQRILDIQEKYTLHIRFAVKVSHVPEKNTGNNSCLSWNQSDKFVSVWQIYCIHSIQLWFTEGWEKPHAEKHKEITNDWHYDASCTQTSLPASDFQNFKRLIFAAKCLATILIEVATATTKATTLYQNTIVYAQRREIFSQ